jgi:hypothetical protein
VRKRSILSAVGTLIALVLSLVVVASASAYLHVYNATSYASNHVWATFCNSRVSTCYTYPSGTGWYDRISDTYIRVQIQVDRYGNGHCIRTFAVHGNDGSEYITSDGSSPYYTCS